MPRRRLRLEISITSVALLLSGRPALAQAPRPLIASPDAGATSRPRPSTDREVIQDLDLLTNLEVLRDLEMYAPTDGGAPPSR